MLSTILLVFHIIFTLSLSVLVLLQKDRSSGMTAFSGASQTLFGSQGSTSFIIKLMAIVAFLFFTTCLGLNLFPVGTSPINADKILKKASEVSSVIPKKES